MGERIAKIKIQREPGYLYYVKSDEEGWLCVYKAILARNGGRKKNDILSHSKEEQK
jgi:hypothetical protein